MRRRDVLVAGMSLAAAPARLARPALAGPSRTILHVPQANLTSLDPVWTTAVVTRNAAHCCSRHCMAATRGSTRSRRWLKATGRG